MSRPYTVRVLKTTLDALLENPVTVALLALLKEKTAAGLEAVNRNDAVMARYHHAEAFGAHELWFSLNRETVLSLDELSQSRLDNHLFQHLQHLDEAIACLGDV